MAVASLVVGATVDGVGLMVGDEGGSRRQGGCGSCERW